MYITYCIFTMIVACLYSTPFLYSVSVFQKRHLPFLLWSLNPIIVLLPLKDAVILKSRRSRVPAAPAMLCPGTNQKAGRRSQGEGEPASVFLVPPQRDIGDDTMGMVPPDTRATSSRFPLRASLSTQRNTVTHTGPVSPAHHSWDSQACRDEKKLEP